LPKFGTINRRSWNNQFDKSTAVTVIDVRGPDEFIGPLGHIAGARNIPVGELNTRLSELAGLEQRPIVLVCRTDKRSAAAGHALHDAGFTHVSVLRRGMEQWNEAGLPVEGRAGAAVQKSASH
jgi:rhodanese-related sulfurtransferase